jgi:hydroxymethylglutaryl-CoA lyase
MFENLPAKVKIVEVGPRDGLQNEAQQVATADKVALIQAMANAGLTNIEVTSFVSPKWIPQLADASDVARCLADLKLVGLTTSCLVPNLKGYERFKESKIDELALFMSATETHSKKNINKSIDEAIAALKEVALVAKADGYRIRCYLSVVFECPYEGKVPSHKVLQVTEKLVTIGVDEVSLGDTIGAATPVDVYNMVNDISRFVDKDRLALHFHDTRGTALANVIAGLSAGVTIFDAALGGLGGCPYAPGAAGNVATEDIVYMLQGMGVDTGVDLEKLVDAGALAQSLLNKQLPSKYLKAALAMREKAAGKQESCV